MCCLAGPLGSDAGALLATGATLVWTFDAGGHFEAMTKYNEYLGRGAYVTDDPSSFAVYPEEWLRRQCAPR
jgi:hypothetical protein